MLLSLSYGCGLLAGEVDFMIVSTGLAGPYIEKGDLRALAITAPTRSASLPNVPTFAEVGYPGYQIIAWCGLAAPAHTPQPILDKLHDKVVAILGEPEIQARFAAGGVTTIPSTAAALDARIKRELAIYRTIIEKANVRVD